jgi:ACT domain-containing protein
MEEDKRTKDIQQQLEACIEVKDIPPDLSKCCAALSSEAAKVIEVIHRYQLSKERGSPVERIMKQFEEIKQKLNEDFFQKTSKECWEIVRR